MAERLFLTQGWELARSPRGVRVTARGRSLADAFAQAALGVFALIVSPASIDERDRREIRAHGASPEAFLAAWIGECLYMHEVEGFVARRVELLTFQDHPGGGGEPLRVHAWLHGEEVDKARHRLAAPPMAPGVDAVHVHSTGTGVEVTVALKSEP